MTIGIDAVDIPPAILLRDRIMIESTIRTVNFHGIFGISERSRVLKIDSCNTGIGAGDIERIRVGGRGRAIINDGHGVTGNRST